MAEAADVDDWDELLSFLLRLMYVVASHHLRPAPWNDQTNLPGTSQELRTQLAPPVRKWFLAHPFEAPRAIRWARYELRRGENVPSFSFPLWILRLASGE